MNDFSENGIFISVADRSACFFLLVYILFMLLSEQVYNIQFTILQWDQKKWNSISVWIWAMRTSALAEHQNPFSFGRPGWPVVDISKPAFIALKYLFIIIKNMTVDNKQFTQDHDEHILWCYEFILPAILNKNKNAEENGTKRTQTAK